MLRGLFGEGITLIHEGFVLLTSQFPVTPTPVIVNICTLTFPLQITVRSLSPGWTLTDTGAQREEPFSHTCST